MPHCACNHVISNPLSVLHLHTQVNAAFVEYINFLNKYRLNALLVITMGEQCCVFVPKVHTSATLYFHASIKYVAMKSDQQLKF